MLSAYLPPIGAALLAGGLIGLEREWRGHPAGLRTHILVCLASALLMLAAVHQTSWMAGTPEEVIRIDPVRMAHGVLTGVGFLCGGVIFRQGLSVHGLTTAASLWITSALGVLFGAGMLGLGAAGAVITLAVLMALRWVDQILPRDRVMEVSVAFRRGGEPTEPAFRTLLAEFGVRPGRLSHTLCDDGQAVELGARLRLRGDVDGHALAERLLADSRVLRFQIIPRND
ncbi:MAG: MgtC/SapB family protein [Phenylobacterium sp.]|nr:MgtC/SapB family protein [Phenylobacterium sp.]